MSDYIFENIDTLSISGNSFSLSTKKWVGISTILKGYRIESKIGDGLAIIDKDPLPQDVQISATIVVPFSNGSYASGEWGLKVASYIDPEKWAKHFENSKLLSYYLTVIKEKFLDDVNDSIKRFSLIRDVNKVDYTLLIDTLNTLGFNIDVTTGSNEFKEDVYRRLLVEAINYYKISGTKYTLDFLSYVHSSFLEFEKLYTNDYQRFTPKPPVGDQSYYLTSRVNIIYDIANYSSREDITKLEDIFYKLAPVNIMINYFIGAFVGEVDLKFLITNNPILQVVFDDLMFEERLIYDNEDNIIFDSSEYFESEYPRSIISESARYIIDNNGNRIVPHN